MNITPIPALKLAAPSPKLLALRLSRGVYRFNEDGELEKKCSRCHEYWPADSEFYFCTKSSDGLHCYCKACYIENRYGPAGRNA